MAQPISGHFADASAVEQTAAAISATSLALLGLTTILLSLFYAGFSFGPMALGMGLFCGALVQIAAGLMAWKKLNAFGAVLGTAYGLFWLSLIAMVVLPETGFGRAPQPSALSCYLAFWGLFTSILFTGASRLGRELQIFLAMFAIFLLLLAAGAAAESHLINALAGGEGIACGFMGVYAGIVRLRNESTN